MSQTNPQSRADHQKAAVMLDRLFTGEQTAADLGGERVLEIQQHVAQCEACRQRFDELAVVDRVLSAEADASTPSGFERDFRDASMMGAIDQMLAQELDAPDEGGDEATVVSIAERSRWQQIARPVVAAAIVLFVVGASIWAPSTMDIIGDEDPGGDFQPRTTTPVDVANSYDKPEIELFCALDVDQDVRFQGSAEAPFGVLSCPKTAKFKVGYRSSDPALKYAAFFGVDQEGVVYWYGPSPVREESWPVQPREKITPVGDTIELDVNHRPGRVRVYGLFTPEPMRHAALDRMLERADTVALFESADFERAGFDGAWATEVFEVVEEGGR